jgi:hypothetical protein
MNWLQKAATTVGGLGRKSIAGGAMVGRKGVPMNPTQVRNSGYRRMGAAAGGTGMMLSRRDSSARRGAPAPKSSGGAGYPPGHSMGGRM